MSSLIPHSKPWLAHAERAAVAEVAASGMLLGGEKTAEFKKNLAVRMGRRTFLFSSGRQSIFAGLTALNLPPNSEVVVQTYVCGAVEEAIRAAGLIPRYCDIEDYWAASPKTVASVFDRKCSAIIIASPFGFFQTAAPFRMFGVPILNDLCQAAPSVLAGESAIDVGDIAAMSFHPTKYLCAGMGAAVDLSGRYSISLAKLENECADRFPLYEFQAAIGIAQLSRLEAISSRRQAIFERYSAAISKSRLASLSELNPTLSGRLLRFPIWSEGTDLEKLFKEFLGRGVVVRHGVDMLAHRMHGINDDAFPAAVSALCHTVSVPFYPALSDTQVDIVSNSLELLS